MEEIEVLSNTQIKKLGERIREKECSKSNCTKEELQNLHDFRLSFKESLNEIFQVLSEVSKQVHKNRIVSFRMKKIDTIISKLSREKGMDLDRMGDIAGCRCIIQSKSAIYKILERLEKKYTFKINDKISLPDEDGYKAIHIYVKSKNCKQNRTVEIQLRTFDQHYWSTLVEIVDVIYNTNIKTGDNSIPELNEFLRVYSDKQHLSLANKIRLVEIEKEFALYNQLNETFRKNLINLRMKWHLDYEAYTNDTYLLFDVDQITKAASVQIFDTFLEAESNYFQNFTSKEGDLLVAHLNVSNFSQMTTAYSNYILTNHDFQDSWIEFCTETANQLIDKFDLENLYVVANSIRSMIENIEDILDNDVNEIDDQFNNRKIDVDQFLKMNQWFEEREVDQDKRYEKFSALERRLELKINEMMGSGRNRFMQFLKSFNPFKNILR
jgi:ppGpp synthetase/RelA/SpoT-type nucleotidyltranferase